MTLAETADLGLIELPRNCPRWCNTDHLRVALEGEGQLTAAQATAHYRDGGSDYLYELRNPVSQRLERAGRGEWQMQAVQHLLDPGAVPSGYAHPPLIELRVRDKDNSETMIAMTAGEVRSLIAHAVALVDHVELGDLG